MDLVLVSSSTLRPDHHVIDPNYADCEYEIDSNDSSLGCEPSKKSTSPSLCVTLVMLILIMLISMGFFLEARDENPGKIPGCASVWDIYLVLSIAWLLFGIYKMSSVIREFISQKVDKLFAMRSSVSECSAKHLIIEFFIASIELILLHFGIVILLLAPLCLVFVIASYHQDCILRFNRWKNISLPFFHLPRYEAMSPYRIVTYFNIFGYQ